MDFEHQLLLQKVAAQESLIERLQAKLAAAKAEISECHTIINIKADWIEATINDMASLDEEIDDFRSEVARLKLVVSSLPMADLLVNAISEEDAALIGEGDDPDAGC
jgi:chromosome segregation ATPase